MIDETSSLEDVAFEVSTALDHFGIEVVLTGGSAATVYAPDVYTSLDADFVLLSLPTLGELNAALASLGYESCKTPGMYEHSRCKYTIDFPKGPLAVGGEYIRQTATLERGNMRLRILTVTDCVRDRLAAFYHWNDYTGLNAAVGVAANHRADVNLSLLREWTNREARGSASDCVPKFQEFLRRLA